MKIYFSASVSGGRDDVDIYTQIVDLLLKYGEVLDKHIAYKNIKSAENHLSNSQIFERCINWMDECDIVFAEVSTPSLGVGYELAYLEKLNKKIYCFYKIGSAKPISPMIEGNKNFTLQKYNTFKEVEACIKEILKKFK